MCNYESHLKSGFITKLADAKSLFYIPVFFCFWKKSRFRLRGAAAAALFFLFLIALFFVLGRDFEQFTMKDEKNKKIRSV